MNKVKSKLRKMTIDVKLAEKYNDFNGDTSTTHTPSKQELVEESLEGEEVAKIDDDNCEIDSDKYVIKVENNLFIANLKTAYNEAYIRSLGIQYAINLVAQEEPKHPEMSHFDEIYRAKLRDNPDCDILETLKEVIKFISEKETMAKFVFFCK